MGQPSPAVFLPSRDGFAFDNSWPPGPGIAIPTPFRTVGIGNAAAGLCGGMVFAALDYWHSRRIPPASRPAARTPLYQFIVRRLIDSWHIPAGVATYYLWMNLPDGDASLRALGRRMMTIRGVSGRTIEHHWPLVRASIDRGVPAALGVVTVATARAGMLGHNHQVLAYGYEVSGSVVTVRVYDPNSGQDDSVHIAFSTSAATAPVTFEHNISIRWPVRGFFLTAYSPAVPPAG